MAAAVNEDNLINLIPEHLFIDEILIRLPVKSLLRCKIVCKEWNFIISSRDFAESQLNFWKSKPSYNQLNTLFLFAKQYCILMKHNIEEEEHDDIGHKSMNKNSEEEEEEEEYAWRIDCDRDEIWDLIDIPEFPILNDEITYDSWDSKCLDSCNGLVCFYFAVNTVPKDFFFIWNPCTNHSKYIFLPLTYKFCVEITGFFYIENDYKIVAFGFPYLSNTKWGGVYSLNTNLWTEIPLQNLPFDIGLNPYNIYFTHWIKGVKIDEMLYWTITDNTYNNNVIGFNIKDHTFHQHPFSNTYFYYGMELCNLGGSLCGWGYVHNNQLDKLFLEIWRIDYKENSELWTIKFKFEVDAFYKDYFTADIIGFTEDDNIIIMQDYDFQLFVVKQNEDHKTVVSRINHYSIFGAIKFNASLVSPYHYTIPNTDDQKVYETMYGDTLNMEEDSEEIADDLQEYSISKLSITE